MDLGECESGFNGALPIRILALCHRLHSHVLTTSAAVSIQIARDGYNLTFSLTVYLVADEKRDE